MTPEQREHLGRIVREEWVRWAKEQPNPKPSWLVEWEGLSEPDKEVDRRIGERIWGEAIQAEREACLQIALDEIAARRVGDAKTDDDAFYLMGGVAAGIKIGNRISARSEGEPGDR